MILLTPFYCIFTFIFTLLTSILASLLAIFADTSGNLPRYLRYFQTFDASLDAGWKDGYFRINWEFAGRFPAIALWWNRTRWLWRNPGYTFDYEVLGIRWYAEDWEVLHHTDTIFLALNLREAAFNLNLNIWRIRFKLGWKAWNHYNSGTKQFDGGNWSAFENIPFVFSISLRKLPQ